MSIKLSVHHEDWPSVTPFRISNAVWETFPCVVVELFDGLNIGRGEGLGIYYFDETPASMTAQIEESQIGSRVVRAAPNCSNCCRREGRATPSIARSGTSRPSRPEDGSGSSRAST